MRDRVTCDVWQLWQEMVSSSLNLTTNRHTLSSLSIIFCCWSLTCRFLKHTFMKKGISAMVIGQNFFKLKVKVKAYMSDIKAKVSKSMILRKNTEIGLEMREDMFRRTDTGHSILSLVPWSRQALGQEILHCGLLHVGAGGGLASSGETVGWSYKQDWYTGYWYSTGSVTPEVARRNMRINIAKIKGCERSWGKRWAILEGSYQDSQEKYNQGDR